MTETSEAGVSDDVAAPGPAGRIALWISRQRGWRKAGLAVAAGIIATAALPPFDLVPTLVPALVAVLWLLDGTRTTRSAFWIGWWFGLGHFATGLYWIANALLIDAARFWWMVPFAVLGLPALLGVFTGSATALTWRSGVRGWKRVLVFAAFWTLAEFARGHVLTGFPWNLIAYAWDGVDPIRQAAAWVGAYGVSLLTVAVLAMPAAIIAIKQGGRRDRSGQRATAFAACVLAIIGAAGWLRLQGATGATEPGVTLRLVQPNIQQTLKWDPAARIANFRQLLELSARPSATRINAVIWPESATAFVLEREPKLRDAAVAILPPGAVLITGTPRVTNDSDGMTRYWNGMVALDERNQVVGTFDKFHLVPFGEYVPLRWLLPIDKVVPGAADFSPGPGPQAIELPGLPPVGPLICYEGIFPGAVVDRNNRPSWLLSLTNDGWYGYSTGPFQHFAQTAWRAVEEGLPIVRVANTGISGVVDAYGLKQTTLGVQETGILDVKLPTPLNRKTIYGILGDVPWILSAIALIAIFWRQHIRYISRKCG